MGAGHSRSSRLENLIKLAHGCKLSRYRQGCQVVPVARRRREGEAPKGEEEGANGRGTGEAGIAPVWYSNTFRVVVAVSTVKLAFTVPPRPLNVADYSAAASSR